jgi:hypothetical protein
MEAAAGGLLAAHHRSRRDNMNRRAAGVTFLAIAALLYIARHLSAAIFGSGVQSWNSDLYRGMLSYVGSDLLVLSIVAALVGIVYLLWGELEKRGAKD